MCSFWFCNLLDEEKEASCFYNALILPFFSSGCLCVLVALLLQWVCPLPMIEAFPGNTLAYFSMQFRSSNNKYNNNNNNYNNNKQNKQTTTTITQTNQTLKSYKHQKQSSVVRFCKTFTQGYFILHIYTPYPKKPPCSHVTVSHCVVKSLAKGTSWHLRTIQTQINLGILAV